MKKRFLTVLVMISALLPASVGAQAVVPAASPQLRRWSVIVDVGRASGGPGGDIERAMRTADLDHPSLFGTQHPLTTAESFPLLVEAQYRIRAPWSVGVLYGRGLTGATSGQGPFFGQLIYVNYAVTSVAAMLSAGPRSLQVGLGPALHRAKSSPGAPGGGQQQWSEHWKVGFIAQTRAMVPASSRIFLDLTVKYSSVGRVVVGPYSATGFGGEVVTFPPTNVQHNHLFIGLGPGLRF